MEDVRRRGHRLALPAVLGLVLGAGPTQAQEWGGSLGMTSDSLYRGLSLSAHRPAWLASLHYAPDAAWVVGIDASGTRPRHDTPGTQLAIYLDRRWQIDPDWSAKLGVAHYDWPGDEWRDDLAYDEINAAIGYRGRVTASIALSPNSTGTYSPRARTGVAGWIELAAHQPLASRLVLDAGLGHAQRSRTGDRNYHYGSLGLHYGVGNAYVFLSRVWIDGAGDRYWGENDDSYASRDARPRWSGSLVWSF